MYTNSDRRLKKLSIELAKIRAMLNMAKVLGTEHPGPGSILQIAELESAEKDLLLEITKEKGLLEFSNN